MQTCLFLYLVLFIKTEVPLQKAKKKKKSNTYNLLQSAIRKAVE